MFLSRSFWLIAWRTLVRHPWQTVLMVLGITLGVAVVVAIDLANASASRAFDLSTVAVAGKATHQITAGPQGLDEQLYTRLRRAGLVSAMAPVVTAYVESPQLGGVAMQLLGIDPFAEPPFRDYLSGSQASGAGGPLVGSLSDFLTTHGALIISRPVAGRYGLQLGAPITLTIAGLQKQAFIAGLLQPGDDLSRRALNGLLLADVATAQELTGRLGRLDRIDLILPDHQPEVAEALRQRLPAGVTLEPVAARTGALEQMTSAFRVNLTALSLLALLVGLFLIYNTMTFSVVQRRPLFGTLRCLGATRQEVFTLVMSEALVVGMLGSGLGLGLGVLLGQGAVRMVTQTINDLFFLLTVTGVQVPASSLMKGALLGVIATLLSAAPPAWEAASVPPRAALSRSGLESKARLAVRRVALAGVALVGVGAGILSIPTRSLVISFAGTFAVVIGFAMLAPLVTRLFMRLVRPMLGRWWGTLGRMAPRNVVNSLSRTAIAVAALMVAVSVTIGVSLMVGSFRHTVTVWLEQTLRGDIYISTPGIAGSAPESPIDPIALQIARKRPGVQRMDVLRAVQVDSPQGPVAVAATDNDQVGLERIFLAQDVPDNEIWNRLEQGAVLVSEPYYNRYRLPRYGGQVTLNTGKGPHTFPVVGIYYDYASTGGTVLMALDVYRLNWNDPVVTAADLRLQPGMDVDKTVLSLQAALAPHQLLNVRANRALRQEVLVVFDRTFAITYALQLLATLVAFVGVLSALLSLELERQRELGILRAIGLTVHQLWGLVLTETGLLGAASGLLALPTGYTLALILVYIINQRSFGWTLQMQVLPAPFLQALLVAVLAALLAGLYPAYRMGRLLTSEALRSE